MAHSRHRRLLGAACAAALAALTVACDSGTPAEKTAGTTSAPVGTEPASAPPQAPAPPSAEVPDATAPTPSATTRRPRSSPQATEETTPASTFGPAPKGYVDDPCSLLSPGDISAATGIVLTTAESRIPYNCRYGGSMLFDPVKVTVLLLPRSYSADEAAEYGMTDNRLTPAPGLLEAAYTYTGRLDEGLIMARRYTDGTLMVQITVDMDTEEAIVTPEKLVRLAGTAAARL